MFTDADLISTYTRAMAVEDGQLIDVSESAREAGIRFPVAMTLASWVRCVEVPPGVEGQNEAGRRWDVVWMLACAIRGGRIRGSVGTFDLLVRNDNRRPRRATLKTHCGPGDDGEPVITLSLPDED